MMSTPSRLIHSSTILAPGSFTVASIELGAPKWPPPPQRSGRPGGAVASLDTPTCAMGAPQWPPTPQRSWRRGGAVAPLDHGTLDQGTLRYAFGAPSADASRARRRACAALSRAIGIMNGEQDTYVMPTL